MSETIQCIAISGDKKMDDLMHAFGVFEPFKAFAVVEKFELTLKPDTTAAKAVEDMVRILTECDRRVVAVFIPSRHYGYLDESVKVISDGQKWCMLDKVLEAYDYSHWELIHKILKHDYDI